MELTELTTSKKALSVNLDDSRYGTFAEIGAGQEVARHFFRVGRASHTVAKTISAYDMTFSDEIYGKEERYVCQARVLRMLDHEYNLLIERLSAPRGKNSRFFAFADTVATASLKGEKSRLPHGWLGVRFQKEPGGPANDIILHVQLLDRFRLQQQEALGILGVNLLYAAFYQTSQPEDVVASLLDHLGPERVEVDLIRFSGPDLQHIDNRVMSLELVRKGLTNAVVFDESGEVLQASDAFFRKPVMIQRGTFRPITNANVEVLERGLEQLKKDPQLGQKEPVVLQEITMNNLLVEGEINQQDFLNRVDTLSALGRKVLISNFYMFYDLKDYLRNTTDQLITILIGASHLERLFNEKHYNHLRGGILEGFGRLFDDKTKIYVFPYKDEQVCQTTQTYHPERKLEHLYKHLISNSQILDILNCDDVDTSIHSRQVRQMLAQNDKTWEELVPAAVRELIRKKGLFGFKDS